jgi:RNA polymerase sigma-70 factor (family 1)
MLKKDLTDTDLVEAILCNDEKAFNVLFERYWSQVYRVAFKYVKDQETALDITHDIFLNIWNKRHELDIHSFKNYVLTSASYHGIRKNQTLKAVPLNYVESYEYTENKEYTNNLRAATNHGDAKIRYLELDREVTSLLNGLPKRCKEIYILSRTENLSINEIADRLQISKRTVENQLTIALKHLRLGLKHIAILFIFLILK